MVEVATLSPAGFGPVGLVQATLDRVAAAKRTTRARRTMRILGFRMEEKQELSVPGI